MNEEITENFYGFMLDLYKEKFDLLRQAQEFSDKRNTIVGLERYWNLRFLAEIK